MKKILVVLICFLFSIPAILAQESDQTSSTSGLAPPLPETGLVLEKAKPKENWVEDTFQLPEEDGLEGCAYAASFSYPYLCVDRKRKIVFDLDRGDDQSVLDKIIRKQGKQNGRYNKLPKK